jgi:hypothetical protein
MAIDRNALDAITNERKGKKNQSRFEDRNKLTVGRPDGNPVTVQPSTYRETPVTVEPQSPSSQYTGVMARIANDVLADEAKRLRQVAREK